MKIVILNPNVNEVNKIPKSWDDKKINRYLVRYNYLKPFIDENKDLDIELFDCVTSNDYIVNENSTITYNGQIMEYAGEGEIYHGVSVMLTHMEIYKRLDEDTFILESDIIFDRDQFLRIQKLIEEFKTIKENNKVLYLQRSIPWLENGPDKPINLRYKVTENIAKADMLYCGAMYFLTKESKKIILDNILPLRGPDALLDRLNKSGIINYYVPTSMDNMFKLNSQLMWL
jgi:hypothetical protein